MTSSIDNNRCKLLVLDIDTNRLNTDDLRNFFISYGPIEWIEMFPIFSSAIIYFVSYLSVERLVSYRTGLINQNHLRFRRFRFDKINLNIDCHTLRVKLILKIGINFKLTELLLFHCFEKYQSSILKFNIFPNNQALIFFSDYDSIDQILLMPLNTFKINNQSLILERMIRKNNNNNNNKRLIPQSRQPSSLPMLHMRDPIIHQLFNQIEHLSKKLREQPGNSRHEIERLEAEIFILKNENAELKSKQQVSLKGNIEQRLTVLEDISNQLISQRRQRSDSNDNNENQIKRHRQI